MSASGHDLPDLDAALARCDWWLCLFDELTRLGMGRAEALRLPAEGSLRRFNQEANRVFRAVRLAVVATLRLSQILCGLADLRGRSAAGIAAARAHARAKAEAEAAARRRAADRASGGGEAGEAACPRTGSDGAERDRPDSETAPGTGSPPRDRDPLVEALDKRLAAVDPAIVDFDDLQLRDTVLRICADLGVTPDWTRWQAGDWATNAAPAVAAPAAAPAPPVPAPAPKSPPPPIRLGPSGPTARRHSPPLSPAS